jgi:hypothetical protein
MGKTAIIMQVPGEYNNMSNLQKSIYNSLSPFQKNALLSLEIDCMIEDMPGNIIREKLIKQMEIFEKQNKENANERFKFCSLCHSRFVRKEYCPKCKRPRDLPTDRPWGYKIFLYFSFCSFVMFALAQFSIQAILPVLIISILVGFRLNYYFIKKAKVADKEYFKWFDLEIIKPDFDKLMNILDDQKRKVYKAELEKVIDEFNVVKEKVFHYENVLFHFNKHEIEEKIREAEIASKNALNQDIEREMFQKQIADLVLIKEKIENIEIFFRAYENQKKCLVANFKLLQMRFLEGCYGGEEDPLRNTLDGINSLSVIMEKVETKN